MPPNQAVLEEVFVRLRGVGIQDVNGDLLVLERSAQRTGKSAERDLGGGFKRGTQEARASVQGLVSDLSRVNITAVLGGAGFIAGLRAIASETFRTRTGLRLLEKQADRNDISFTDLNESLAATADKLGLLPTDLADNAAQLLRLGLSVEEIETLFTGGAASALAFGRSAADGIQNVSAAVLTGRSVLLDTIGITQNLGTEYVKYARTLGKTSEELTELERAQAAVALVSRFTKEEVEDLPELLAGYAGATNRLRKEMTELRLTIGDDVLPTVTGATNAMADLADQFTKLPPEVRRAIVIAGLAAGGMTTLAGAIGLVVFALGPLIGPAGIAIAVAAGLGAIYGATTDLESSLPRLAEDLANAGKALKGVDDIESYSEALTTLENQLTGSAKTMWQEFAREAKLAADSIVDIENATLQLLERFTGLKLLPLFEAFETSIGPEIAALHNVPVPEGTESLDVLASQELAAARDALLTGNLRAFEQHVDSIQRMISAPQIAGEFGVAVVNNALQTLKEGIDKAKPVIALLERQQGERDGNEPPPPAATTTGGKERTPQEIFADYEKAIALNERLAGTFDDFDLPAQNLGAARRALEDFLEIPYEGDLFAQVETDYQAFLETVGSTNRSLDELAEERQEAAGRWVEKLFAQVTLDQVDAGDARRLLQEAAAGLTTELQNFGPLDTVERVDAFNILAGLKEDLEAAADEIQPAVDVQITPVVKPIIDTTASEDALRDLETARQRFSRAIAEGETPLEQDRQILARYGATMGATAEQIANVDAILANFRDTVARNNATAVLDDTFDAVAANANAAQSALIDLEQEGLAPQGAAVQEVQAAYEAFNETLADRSASEAQAATADHLRDLQSAQERVTTALTNAKAPLTADLDLLEQYSVTIGHSTEQLTGMQQELSRLEARLRQNELRGEIEIDFDVEAANAAAVQDAILGLRELGISEQGTTITALTEQLREYIGVITDREVAAAQAEQAENFRELESARARVTAAFRDGRAPLEADLDLLRQIGATLSGTADQVAGVQQVMETLNQTLARNEATAELDATFDLAAANAQALLGAILALREEGLDPEADLLTRLTGLWEAFTAEANANAAARERQLQSYEELQATLERLGGTAPTVFEQLRAEIEKSEKAGAITTEQMEELLAVLNEIEGAAQAESFAGLAEAVERLAGVSADPFEELADRIRQAAADGDITNEQMEELLGTLQQIQNIVELIGTIDLVGDIAGGVRNLMNASSATDIIGGATDVASTVGTAIGGPLVGQVIGAVGGAVEQVVGVIQEGFDILSGNALQRQYDQIQEGFNLIEVDDLVTTKTRSDLWGFLFGAQEVDEAASRLGLAIAQGIDAGMTSGFASAVDAIISGDGNALEALERGLYEAVLAGITEAIIQGAIIEGVLAEDLEAMAQAFKDGDVELARKIAGDIYAKLPEIAADLEETLAPFADFDGQLGIDDDTVNGIPSGTFSLPGATPGFIGTPEWVTTQSAAADTMLEAANIIRDVFGSASPFGGTRDVITSLNARRARV